MFKGFKSLRGKIGVTVISLAVVLALAYAFFSSLPLTDHGPKAAQSSQTFISFGTLIQLKASGELAEEALMEAKGLIYELEGILSAKDGSSEVSHVNSSSGNGSFVKISEHTFKVVERSLYFSGLSGGKFDVSIKPLSDLWDIGGDNPHVPSAPEIESALDIVGHEKILLERDDGWYAKLGQAGMGVDLGGIAKGYAADLVYDVFCKHQVNGLVNMGGNIVTVGENPDNLQGLWRVAIPNPRGDRNDAAMILNVSGGLSVVTSGDYERFFISDDGKRYHHILDPDTGYPASNGITSVTIIGPSSMDSDALSTSVFLLGVIDGMELVASFDGFECVVITEDREVFVSDGIRDGKYSLEVLSEDYDVR